MAELLSRTLQGLFADGTDPHLAGKYDYTCWYDLQKEYCGMLRAPEKEFYTFENSAHSPLFEEPEKARKILTELVFADKKS